MAMTPSRHLSILISLLRLFCHVAAQPNSTTPPNSSTSSSTPVIILVIFTTVAFFFSLFIVLFCECNSEVNTTRAVRRSRSTRARRRGLDPAVLETFPTLLYSDVKEHKVGNGALECAVCLSELEDEEMLRLLMPKCNHVFHLECIDRWLELHTTCPVCRANLGAVDDLNHPSSSSSSTGDAHEENLQQQQQEDESVIDIPEMENSAPVHWPSRSTSAMAAVGRRLERLYSDNDRERFTLRLPDHIQREVFSGKLGESSRFFSMERSRRRGYRRENGEGTSSGGGGWSMKIRSDRWAFLSSFNWRSSGANEEDGGDPLEASASRLTREKSSKGKLFGPLDCLGNDPTKSEDEEVTLPLADLSNSEADRNQIP